MLNKAELASSLVERVPRSILLAELINRMPERLALLDFDMKSERMKPPAPPTANKDVNGKLAPKGAPERAKTLQEANEVAQKIETPRYKVVITMVGVAPTDLEVSKYMSELNAFPLLREVALDVSEEKNMDNRTMRQFKITMSLDPDADVRRIDPLIEPRVRNPTTDKLQFTNPNAPVSGSNTPEAPIVTPSITPAVKGSGTSKPTNTPTPGGAHEEGH